MPRRISPSRSSSRSRSRGTAAAKAESEGEEEEHSETTREEGMKSQSEEEDDEEKNSSEPTTPTSTTKRVRKSSNKRKSQYPAIDEEDEESAETPAKRPRTKSAKKKPATSSSSSSSVSTSSSPDPLDVDDRSKRKLLPIASSGGAPIDPDELPDEWRCSANDALTFRLVRSAPEKETNQLSTQVELYNFHPTFTHQLWDDEEIVGYKKVKAIVQFTSGALYTHIKVDYEEKYPNTDVPDIQDLITSKLRGGYTLDAEDFKSHIHDPFVPPGEKLAEYTVPSVDLSFKEIITYEVYRGRFDDPTMRAYHQRLQFFLLFFIDRSSYINDNDLVWEIILLFQKRVCLSKDITTYHIVGYTTLYRFLSYPSGWKMRLSQILILPPYQRSGHGVKLLQLVYQEAEKRSMVELNIEDPSPVFQMIRDLTDITMCKKGRFFEKQPGMDFDPLERWNPVYASVVKASLRITMAQVRRCYEIFRLNAVNDRHKNSKGMVAYRLEVKGRIYREEQEVLSLYSQKPELRKEKLSEIYNELEQHYLSVIKKARLH